MTIAAICDHEAITVTPKVASTGDSLGVEYEDGTAFTKRCLVQELSAQEALEYKAEGFEVDYIFYFSANPGIKKRDKITTADGVQVEVKAAFREGRPGKWLLWVVLGDSIETRDR